MSFIQTFTREKLQGLAVEYRKQMLYTQIDNGVANAVLQAAREGKTQYFWNQPGQTHKFQAGCHKAPLAFTTEEYVAALEEKFEGAHVEYQETWEEVRPGVKEQRKGILIDWS